MSCPECGEMEFWDNKRQICDECGYQPDFEADASWLNGEWNNEEDEKAEG